MSKAERFEDLRVWQESRLLANALYDTTESLRDFPFRDQLRRAGVSIMNNIAEGFERHSDADFAHFLTIAKGSSGEVRSMLYLGEDRHSGAIRDPSDSSRIHFRRTGQVGHLPPKGHLKIHV